MQIIDKYIYAIGRKLPFDSREEIKLELKSLLLDEIESSYGENPTESEIEQVIYDFGSPTQVAARYKKDNVVVSSKFTNLFFMIIKIIFFALIVAFSVVFVIDLLTDGFNSVNLSQSLLKLVSNIISATLGGIGALTLVFIFITKISDEHLINFNGEWSIKELENVEVSRKNESKIEISFEIFFTIIFLALINISPEIINTAELFFEKSGISLGHYLNIEVFKNLIIFISFVWLFEIIADTVRLITGYTKALTIFDLVTQVLNLAILIVLVTDMNLYNNYTSLLGLRAIFMLVTFVAVLEIIASVVNYFKFYVRNV